MHLKQAMLNRRKLTFCTPSWGLKMTFSDLKSASYNMLIRIQKLFKRQPVSNVKVSEPSPGVLPFRRLPPMAPFVVMPKLKVEENVPLTAPLPGELVITHSLPSGCRAKNHMVGRITELIYNGGYAKVQFLPDGPELSVSIKHLVRFSEARRPMLEYTKTRPHTVTSEAYYWVRGGNFNRDVVVRVWLTTRLSGETVINENAYHFPGPFPALVRDNEIANYAGLANLEWAGPIQLPKG